MSEVWLRMGAKEEEPGVLSRVQNEVREDKARKVKLCKRGHVRSPENLYKGGGCKACTKDYQRTEKNKEYQKNYKKTPDSREKQKARERERYAIYRKLNPLVPTERKGRDPARLKLKAARHYLRYKDAIKLKTSTQAKAYRDQLSDIYIRSKLHIKKKEAVTDMIEIKRLTIQLQRSIKNGNQISK
jgi:hypothetical protein